MFKRLLEQRILRKYLYNTSMYSGSTALNYDGIIEVILYDKDGNDMYFVMAKKDARMLAHNIKEALNQNDTNDS